ncbi:serine/threonine protein kinase, partial [Streptomyces sp. NPDC002920]
AQVPGAPAGAGGYDPNAATSVLQHTSGPAGAADPTAVLPHAGGPAGAADPTAVLPHAAGHPGAADPTAVMPPMPPGQPGQQGQQPEQPHPWQSQMRAARDRNEPTQVQYLDPGQDPLRHRPQRQVARPQQPPQRRQQPQQGPPPGYGYPQQPQQQYAPPQPPPQPQQPRRQQPQPQRHQPQQRPAPEPRPTREPREPREPRQRGANPMKIPGLGCLKGCLFTIVIFIVAGWLIWEFSPLQGWIGTGRTWWGELSHWFNEFTDFVGDLGSGNKP